MSSFPPTTSATISFELFRLYSNWRIPNLHVLVVDDNSPDGTGQTWLRSSQPDPNSEYAGRDSMCCIDLRN